MVLTYSHPFHGIGLYISLGRWLVRERGMEKVGRARGWPCCFSIWLLVPYLWNRGLLGLNVTIHGVQWLFNTRYLLLPQISLLRKERSLSGMEGSREEGCSGLFHRPRILGAALCLVPSIYCSWRHLGPSGSSPTELLVGIQGLGGSFIHSLPLLSCPLIPSTRQLLVVLLLFLPLPVLLPLPGLPFPLFP